MTAKEIDLAYRALMPGHYSPRRNSSSKGENTTRKWDSTRLPKIRVFGPFWSFGFHVVEFANANSWPDGTGPKDSSLRGLRTLGELSKATKNPALEKVHYPTLLAARVESFAQVDSDLNDLWESRSSLLAVRTIKNVSADGSVLTKFAATDFPVTNGMKLGSGGNGETLLVAPIGDPQLEPDKVDQDKKTGRKDGQHLPAMQLIHGRVAFVPPTKYLDVVRKKLNLLTPTSKHMTDTMFLLPDGFTLAGQIDVPWMKDKPVEGWFKVTFRHLEAHGGAAVGRNEPPVLQLWLDAETGAADWGLEWRACVNELESLMRQAREHAQAPRWLDLRPNARLSPENLFWPLAYESIGEMQSILVHRPDKSMLRVGAAGLVARLADRPLSEAPLTNLTIEPDSFLITRKQNAVMIASGDKPIYENGKFAVHYEFDGGAEKLNVYTVKDKNGKQADEIELAVPMVETAESLRQIMDLPRPLPEDKVLAHVWVFTPLNEGWLHWPLPNATPAILSRLLNQKAKFSEENIARPNEAADGISGALSFGNRPGSPGHSADERNWSLALIEPKYAQILATLDLNERSFIQAKAELVDCSISLDGALPVTPFRQTSQRLLPDHAERALTTFGLRAISPASLTGVEQKMWEKASQSPTAPDVAHLSITLTKVWVSRDDNKRGARRYNIAAGLFWSVAMPTDSPLQAPWIWVRQTHLPTAQNLPLAAVGSARNMPSEARSLAPLEYSKPASRLKYAGAVNMSEPTIDLIKEKDTVGVGPFQYPSTAHIWRAETGMVPREEIGMAVTTLPSLTLFAGHTANSPGVSLAKDSWSGFAAPGMTALARHDIALRDEFHAFAVAPRKPKDSNGEDGGDKPPELELFTPLPGNGPGVPGTTNGYDKVWVELTRKAGLAALDRRDMLQVKKGQAEALINIFGETSYNTDSVKLDFTVQVVREGEEVQGAIEAVSAIGVWSLDLQAGTDPKSVVFSGLPNRTDLEGLAGTFQRGGNSVEVKYGAATLAVRNGHFMDQYGLDIEEAKPLRHAAIIRTVHNHVLNKSYRLVTLTDPVPVEGHGDLAFWCSDVPTGKNGEEFLAAYAAPDLNATRLNGASLDNNALAGFRWTLTYRQSPSDTVVIDGFVFEPLELVAMTCDDDGSATVTIAGRLRLPVGKTILPQAGGKATLTLTYVPGGCFRPKLEALNVLWPLVDPATATGFVPTLFIPHLKAIGPKDEQEPSIPATLTFGFVEAVYTIKVDLMKGRDANGPVLLATVDGGPSPKPQKPEFGAIEVRGLTLNVARAQNGGGIKPHKLELHFMTKIGQSDARIVSNLDYDLLGTGNPVSKLRLIFHGPGDAELEVGLYSDEQLTFDFGTGHLALRWQIPEKTIPEAPPRILLDGFKVLEGQGALFATFVVDTEGGALTSLPSLQLTAVEDEARFMLETLAVGRKGSSILHLVRARRPGEEAPFYRLWGKLEIANAFSWPRLTVSSADKYFEQATLPANSTDRFTHEATIFFRGDPLRQVDREVLVAAMVEHRITLPDAGWTWRTHQHVRLLTRTAFMARLENFKKPPTKNSNNLRKTDVGFSPFFGPAGKELTDYAAAPHFLHIAASGPGGIAGPMAGDLLQSMSTNDALFLTIDLSSHALLDFRTRGGELILSSLPAVAFCLARYSNTPLPWTRQTDIEAMFKTKVDATTRLVQPVIDGIAARSLPALEPRMAGLFATRLAEARGAFGQSGQSTAAALLPFADERLHRPVFQAVAFTLQTDKKTWQAAWNRPGAATAMHLSVLFDRNAGRNTNPVALGMRWSGGITGDDLFEPTESGRHPLASKTLIDVEDYVFAMRRFHERLLYDLVPGPDFAPEPEQSGDKDKQSINVILRLVARARDGTGTRVIVEQIASLKSLEQVTKVLAQAAAWGKLSLARLAPWARIGLVSAATVEPDGEASASLTSLVYGSREPARRVFAPRPIFAMDGDRPAQRQREQVARPYSIAIRAVAGYSPLAAEPRLFTSEPGWSYGEEPEDYRLTATGIAMAWSLAGPDGAMLGAAPDSRALSSFWITDRHRPVFRPFAVAADGGEITFALPQDFHAHLPAALAPANHVMPPQKALNPLDWNKRHARDKETLQSFAPAIVTVAKISSRPGAFTATRTGLASAAQDTQMTLAMVDASQTPVHMRQPRPPILARNDRPRASSHEGGLFHLGRSPTAIIHGPRAARSGASNEPMGLDRRPRSAFAQRIRLVEPAFGIAITNWSGVVKIEFDALFASDYADSCKWTVEAAAFVVGTSRYSWRPGKMDLRKEEFGVGDLVRLVNFQGGPGGGAPETSARSGLLALPAATPAVLEVTFKHLRKEGDLLRQVRFDILTATGGIPGIEVPLFFRFDDPEYNDRLQGIAKLARQPSPSAPSDDFVFAADMADIRFDQRLELALALRPSAAGAELALHFTAKDNSIMYGGKEVRLIVERLRAGSGEATKLCSDPNDINVGMEPMTKEMSEQGYKLRTSAASSVFHAMKLDCSSLRVPGEPVPALAPDDMLQLVIALAGADQKSVPIVTLRFDVVATPAMPANPSSFGVLTLNPEGTAVAVHLFAGGPETAVIELVDPLDLVEGVVRRRAIYQWRSFHRAKHLYGEKMKNPARFALQKINSVGGTWLPTNTEGGWLTVENKISSG